MKAINFQAIITSIRALKDGSLSLTIHSPELTSEEKAEFMNLQNVVLDALLQPEEMQFPEIKRVKSDLDTKTPSERLRGALFVLWKKRGEEGEFRRFYEKNMEKFIRRISEAIDEEELK